MTIEIIDPTTNGGWDDFVSGRHDGTIFHTSAWARTIREAYGYTPRYYVLTEAGQIHAAVPFFHVQSPLTGSRLVCLPFSDYCYPLGPAEGVMALIEHAKDDAVKRDIAYIEIRGQAEGVSPARLSFKNRDYFYLYVLDLDTDAAGLNERFHDSVRRGIRQAEKRGVNVRLSSSEADLELFYQLHTITRKKLGVLPQPKSFFRALYRHVIAQNLGFTGLAELDNQVIAGVVFLNYNKTIYYKFNASDERFLQKRPNHLVTWEAIRYALEREYQYFDLGRCSSDEESLRVYKMRWGAREIQLPYFYYPEARGTSAISENSWRYRAMRLFSRVAPKFVFEAAGTVLYRHLA